MKLDKTRPGRLKEMKGRLFVGGVSAALLAGGMMLATGCASVEDAPMPPGAYVPPETEAPIAVKGQTIRVTCAESVRCSCVLEA